jgi:hypothetical protein
MDTKAVNKMNINLNKSNIDLILDALESYRLDIEHGNKNGNEYVWTENEVGNLVDFMLETMGEK